jgi:hypothetical protein
VTDPFKNMNLGFKLGAKLILDCFPDPKKINNEEIKPEEELDFEDWDEDEEDYDDEEHEE